MKPSELFELKPNYTKSFKNILLLYTTSQDGCFLTFVLIKLLTKKLGKGHLSQMRYIHLFVVYSVNMFVSVYVSGHDVWILDFGYITFYYGKHRKKVFPEMGMLKNGRSNIFSITQIILIYNVWAASMRLVNKLEVTAWLN